MPKNENHASKNKNPPPTRSNNNPSRFRPKDLLLLSFCILLLALLFSGLFIKQEACKNDATTPIFTDPNEKIAELQTENFTMQLFKEAVAYEPLLNKTGTQANMGYWSGAGNHGSLVRLLDEINNYGAGQGMPPEKAIWDEGTQSSLQYPSYVLMNAREHWYERAAAGSGRATIYGIEYADPHPVTFQQADLIWGEYSRRYADMALMLKNATGRQVQVWCFVQGAKQNRVFYSFEYPRLLELQEQGVVALHFAKSQNADWRNQADWSDAPMDAPVEK